MDGKALAGDAFAVDTTGSTADVEGSFDIGLDNVGEACGDVARHLSVDDGHALLVGDVGAGKDREPFERGASEVAGTVVDFIAYFETSA